jgi:hypothetical protein
MIIRYWIFTMELMTRVTWSAGQFVALRARPMWKSMANEDSNHAM